jgi:FolB domain-containing protein
MIEPLDDDARIHIHQLEVMTRIGVPDEERATAQRLTFNVTLWPGRPFGQLNDDIDRAVNYAAVCVEVKKFVETRSDRLIETLADVLAQHLLGLFALRRITIELRKYILPEVEFVSVQITRERADG